jgi:hypothetical protein
LAAPSPEPLSGLRKYLSGRRANGIISAIAAGALIQAMLIFAVELFQVNVPLIQFFIGQTSGSGGQSLQYQPLGSSPSGQAVSGFLYIIPAIAATFGMVYLARRNPRVWFKLVIGIAFALGSFFIGFVSYWWWLGFWPTAILIVGLATAVLVSFTFKSRTRAALAGAPFKIWFAVGFAFLSFLTLPFFMCLAIICGFAVWDIIAVFRGPLKEVVKSEGKAFQFLRTALMLDFGLGGIGLGDLYLYSLMTMLAASLGFHQVEASYIAILAGVMLSYYLLRTREKIGLPGLPLPVLFFIVSVGALTLA